MKNHLLALVCLFISTSTFAGSNSPFAVVKDNKDNKDKTGFWHHCGEFHLTPSADYYIYRKGTVYEAPEPYQYQMPFIGFDMGGQYMYRPVEVFAISAGLGFRMQGNFTRHTTTPFLQSKYVDYRSMGHMGVLQVPIEFHLFKRLPHCTFEFATGPQFNFPVFATNTTTTYMPDGDKISTDKDKTNFDTDVMRENAMLGWNILMGGEIHLCDKSDLFIGPQINFLNIAYFDKDITSNRRKYGSDTDISLGLKLGFRFHCENTMGYE
jgi:hypothetical protein